MEWPARKVGEEEPRSSRRCLARKVGCAGCREGRTSGCSSSESLTITPRGLIGAFTGHCDTRGSPWRALRRSPRRLSDSVPEPTRGPLSNSACSRSVSQRRGVEIRSGAADLGAQHGHTICLGVNLRHPPRGVAGSGESATWSHGIDGLRKRSSPNGRRRQEPLGDVSIPDRIGDEAIVLQRQRRSESAPDRIRTL